jgi:hypothetical protein
LAKRVCGLALLLVDQHMSPALNKPNERSETQKRRKSEVSTYMYLLPLISLSFLVVGLRMASEGEM